MVAIKRAISADALAEARRRYEETDERVADIARDAGFGERTFYDRLHEWGWRRRSERWRFSPRPTPHEETAFRPGGHVGRPCPGLAACPERSGLAARLWRVTEAHVAQVEKRLSRKVEAADARLTAILAATLDKLVALDRNALKAAERADADKAAPAHDAHDPDAALARLATLLAAAGEPAGPDEDPGGADAG